MCGIFAVLREAGKRSVPTAAWVQAALERAVAVANALDVSLIERLTAAQAELTQLDQALKGTAGVRCLLDNPRLLDQLNEQVGAINALGAQVEADLDAGLLGPEVELEVLNRALVGLKDVTWALTRDRLRTAVAVGELLGELGNRATSQDELGNRANQAVEAYTSIQLALSAIDRLEVRGRDSAGIAVLVSGHGLDANSEDQAHRRHHPEFLSGAVSEADGVLVFVYKTAAEIGALGDNVRVLRAAIAADNLLRRALCNPGAWASVVAHTRWASCGTVSEPNTHPVDSQEVGGSAQPYVVAAHNGDIDNYLDLKTAEHLHLAEDITTDSKVIPVLVSRRLAAGANLQEAFCSTVARFEGSVAIAAASTADPSKLLLAVNGSGQGCYIGLAEDAFLVASEPYGLVEECSSYLRLDGETPSPGSGRHGQVVVLERGHAGTLTGIARYSYGGEELPISPEELVRAEVTTRDIDRGGAPHFLLKEISESPQSVRRTLRGKIADDNGRLVVQLGPDVLPDSVRTALANGTITRILAIGQGTAAIASRSLVTVLDSVAPSAIATAALPATELSGFGLRDDMSDTLVVAVSQSGTTTDTNRTVDLVRSRGAKVIAIVNRRQSDLTEKADGVLYTSDGRDVEMSVASTKAFYAQVTAASLLAIALADVIGKTHRQHAQALLRALRALPDAMGQVLAKREVIAAAAQQYAPYRRSWALVGNGPNFIAANELRIKLSELCYKSIAVDATEDKKHIDLSAEPMILVCAAGLSGSNASDVAKEVAIYRAHKAVAIVICSDPSQFQAASAIIEVPSLHPTVDFVLSTVAGHLFGYEAALAIDAQARLLRTARAVLDDAMAHDVADEDELLARVRASMAVPAAAIFAELQSGALNGHLNTGTAVQLVSLLRYAGGILPLDMLELELGRPTSPLQLMADLLAVLTSAIDELTRPIDAVKHQAKTVTVGISRTEDSFAGSVLVQQAVNAGALRDRLSYRSMRTLAALDAGVVQVVGYTRYQVQGDVVEGSATLTVLDRGGIAQGIVSRAQSDPRLTGTKRRAAFERQVTVGRGQRDGRSVIIVPEGKDQQITGITLLHVEFQPTVQAREAKAVLTGYRNRYAALVDAVTETEPDFDDERLSQIGLLDLLVEPVWILAEHWRNPA